MTDLLRNEYFTNMLSFLAVTFVLREIVTFKDFKPLRYLLTPLVTLLIAGVVVLSIFYEGFTAYRLLVLTGLTLSLIADTILMIKEVDLLKYGIVYFLLAHIAYIMAFRLNYSFSWWNVVLAIVLAAGIISFIMRIWGKTGGLDIPILVYAGIISVMVFFALAGVSAGINRRTGFALLGAVLFIVSDFILAINAFLRKIPHDSVIVWSLYAPGQFFIALSCFG